MPEATRILVVDDDKDLRHVMCELLQDEGYEVQGAENGAAALELLRSGRPLPHQVLLDLMMPGVDGWQFRELQRADPRLAHLPVVALTASRNLRAYPPLEVDALALKPVDFDELLQLVRRYTAREPRPSSGALAWDAHVS